MIPAFVLGSVLLVMGLILRYLKIEMNSVFGYRTYLSMKSEANWKFANEKFAKHAIIIGMIGLCIGLVSFVSKINTGYVIFGLLSLILGSIIYIEVSLKKFDRKLN